MADPRLIPAGIRDASMLAMNKLIDRMGSVDLTPLLVYILDDVTPTALPHLIEQFHVAGNEGARLAENDTNKRELVKRAIALHKLKGTPAGLKQALESVGLVDVMIIEGVSDLTYNGSETYDGLYDYGDPTGWAEYLVRVGRPVTNDQVPLIIAMCEEFAPARCHLRAIDYTRAALRYDGTSFYNGTYNHGVI